MAQWWVSPGLDSRSRRHMWVEFVGSLFGAEKRTILKCTGISERVLVNSLVLRG